jgi:hypothetical protein
MPAHDLNVRPVIGEEEIADVSLATSYVFDKENADIPEAGIQLARAAAVEAAVVAGAVLSGVAAAVEPSPVAVAAVEPAAAENAVAAAVAAAAAVACRGALASSAGARLDDGADLARLNDDGDAFLWHCRHIDARHQ